MSVKNILVPATLTTVAGGDFTSSFQAINPGGLPKGVCLLRIINNSDVNLFISYDGSTNHDFVPTLTSVNINAQTNSQPNNNAALFAGGTVIYVKGGDDTSTGDVYLAAYYQPQA